MYKFRRFCGLIVLSFSPAASFYFSCHLGELICLYLYNFLVFSGFFGLPRFIFLRCWVIFSGCLAIISCFFLGFFPLPLYFCMYLGDFVSLWTNFLVFLAGCFLLVSVGTSFLGVIINYGCFLFDLLCLLSLFNTKMNVILYKFSSVRSPTSAPYVASVAVFCKAN